MFRSGIGPGPCVVVRFTKKRRSVRTHDLRDTHTTEQLSHAMASTNVQGRVMMCNDGPYAHMDSARDVHAGLIMPGTTAFRERAFACVPAFDHTCVTFSFGQTAAFKDSCFEYPVHMSTSRRDTATGKCSKAHITSASSNLVVCDRNDDRSQLGPVGSFVVDGAGLGYGRLYCGHNGAGLVSCRPTVPMHTAFSPFYVEQTQTQTQTTKAKATPHLLQLIGAFV